MYRAVIVSKPTKNSKIRALTATLLKRDLVRQFVASPMCSSVAVDIVDTNHPNLKSKLQDSKIVRFSSYSDLAQSSAPNLLVNIGGNLPEDFEVDQVDRLVLVSSIFNRPDIDALRRRLKGLVAGKPVPVSVFETGHILPSFSKEDAVEETGMRSKKDVVGDAVYSIGSQFLSAKYREIQSKHLAQAIRLNYETCEGEFDANNVEYLNFVDCMKVIGLEEKI
jgi:hypothetical protein